MDGRTLLKTRRSIRSFKPDVVDAVTLDNVLDAATYAPTGMGAQAPQIVVVRDKDTQDKLRAMNAAVMGSSDDPYYGAPVIIVVLAPIDSETWVEDATSVLIYLQLAAHNEGLASVWVHRERQIFDSDEGKALLLEWGVPDNFKGVGGLALGYANGDLPATAPRREGYVLKV